ncbi:MAG: hypothetical protein KAS93_05280 [Gammaproteobacteria bacterium]|nr:hypothetical protein [Gammaproteobacteria bacterium]
MFICKQVSARGGGGQENDCERVNSPLKRQRLEKADPGQLDTARKLDDVIGDTPFIVPPVIPECGF